MLLKPKTVLYNKEKFQVLVFLPIYNISKIKKSKRIIQSFNNVYLNKNSYKTNPYFNN